MHSKELNYNDIGLVPRKVSEIKSRSSIDPRVKFCGLDIFPLVAAPMCDVSSSSLIISLRKAGSYGWIHRFQTVEEQAIEYEKVLDARFDCGCAIGLDDLDRLKALYDIGCNSFLIDVANAGNTRVLNFIEQINSQYDVYLTIGNVNSVEIVRVLSDYDIQGIRVGISGGSHCTTKNATGIQRGQISMLQEIWKQGPFGFRIICDGGIKIPGDMCKALIWSDLVMAGGVFAASYQSPAKEIRTERGIKKLFRGSASFSVQQLYREKPKHIEGTESLIDIGSSIEDIIQKFRDGLCSSMSYANALSLSEFREKMDWCIVQ